MQPRYHSIPGFALHRAETPTTTNREGSDPSLFFLRVPAPASQCKLLLLLQEILKV